MATTTPSRTFSTRALGNSDLQLTPIGYGAWAIGGGNWEFAWGAQDDAESIRTIQRALDSGLSWIDTAAIYGLGHSEEVGWHADRSIYRSLTRESLEEEVENSLRRLGLDTIDLYQIHWPDPQDELEE